MIHISFLHPHLSPPLSQIWLHGLEGQRVGAKPCKSFQAFLIGKISRSSIEFRNLLRLIPVKPLLSRGAVVKQVGPFLLSFRKVTYIYFFLFLWHFQCLNVVVSGMVYIKEKHAYFFGCDRRDLQVWPLSHSLQNDCLPSSCLPGFIHTNCAVADPLSAKKKKKKKRQDRTWHDMTRSVWASSVSHRTWRGQ